MNPKNAQKITLFVWFDNQAEQAAGFYVFLFKNPKIKRVFRYNVVGAAGSDQPEGSL